MKPAPARRPRPTARRRWRLALATAAALFGAALPAPARDLPQGLASCQLKGVEHDALCGSIARPLDPTRSDGPTIEIHFAVLPAVARNKKPDPVFFFAGGPGQSAIDLAGSVAQLLARLGNRRDIVLIDQRGTGRSAPLRCVDEVPTQPLRDTVDLSRQAAQLQACRRRLERLPYGDLRRFTTTLAMQDADAVRQQLGASRIDLVGGSYGTRAALEFMRQFPLAVRRAVLDGVAPPDMALPGAASPDSQAAFDALLLACATDATCHSRYPDLHAQWRALLAGLPREIVVAHPVTNQDEHLTLTRAMLAGLVRQALYVPVLASALPLGLAEAAQGRFTPIFGLSAALGGRRTPGLAQGMHFSVICAEDMPRLATTADRPGADFGDGTVELYRDACADWPRGEVPPAFYGLPPAPAATLVLSGGIDPVTPPRHGERVARALGAKARHVVVANAGHGVLALGCMRDVVFHFIDADSDEQALRVDAGCAAALPRPPAFVPIVAPAAR